MFLRFVRLSSVARAQMAQALWDYATIVLPGGVSVRLVAIESNLNGERSWMLHPSAVTDLFRLDRTSDFLGVSVGSRAAAERILLDHPTWRVDALFSAQGILDGDLGHNLPTDQTTGTAFGRVDFNFQVQPLPLILFVSPLYHSDIFSLSMIRQVWSSQSICSVHALPSGMLVRTLHAFFSDCRNPVLRT